MRSTPGAFAVAGRYSRTTPHAVIPFATRQSTLFGPGVRPGGAVGASEGSGPTWLWSVPHEARRSAARVKLARLFKHSTACIEPAVRILLEDAFAAVAV